MYSRPQLTAIQVRKLPTPIRKIGMDMTAPYTIYVDGSEYANFPSESEADAVYAELREKMNPAVCGVH